MKRQFLRRRDRALAVEMVTLRPCARGPFPRLGSSVIVMKGGLITKFGMDEDGLGYVYGLGRREGTSVSGLGYSLALAGEVRVVL